MRFTTRLYITTTTPQQQATVHSMVGDVPHGLEVQLLESCDGDAAGETVFTVEGAAEDLQYLQGALCRVMQALQTK